MTLLYAVVALVVGPAMYSDSALGFRVWDSMRQGAGFNQMLNVEPADIARDRTYFKAAWTPGQYLLPGALEALGLALGPAIVVVVTVASLLGLWGWYALYRAFGFSARTSAIALLVIACGRNFALPFGTYNGGEVLVFAGLPWGLLVVWRLRDLRWSSIPVLLATIAGVVFLKLSGIIVMGAAVAGVVPSAGQPLLGRETLRRALVAAATLVLGFLLLQWAWVSRGWTAVEPSAGAGWSQVGPSVALAIASTWSAIFGFGSLVQYVFFFPGRALLETATPINVALVVPALATLAFLWLRLRRDYADYLRFALIVAGLVTGFLLLLLVIGSPIGADERHFRPVALLLTVGVVEAFVGSRSLLARGIFAGLFAVSAAYGLGSRLQHVRTNLNDPLGTRGVRMHALTPPVRDFLRTIDRPDADGERPLIVVPAPEVALEIRHARILTTDADFQTPQQLAAEVRRGRVRRLYVLLPRALERNGKAAVILKSFADYPADAWKRTELGDTVVFASAPEP